MHYTTRLRNAVVFGFAALALFTGIFLAAAYSERPFVFLEHEKEKGEGAEKYEQLVQQEGFWHDRLTYPTGRFDPAWMRAAAAHDAQIPRGVPDGVQLSAEARVNSPFTLDPNSVTALGPKP